MKSGKPLSLLALTASALGGISLGRALTLVRALPNPLGQSPRQNQRKARKARRARFAAGDRKAFR